MLQNGKTYFKNIADSRFTIKFKIIHCQILKLCLMILEF